MKSTEEVRADVLQRLLSFGVAVDATSGFAVNFAVERAREKIKNDTNQLDVPDGLYHVFIDMAAGYYMQAKRAVGQLDVDGIDISVGAAKSIREGDVEITFATSESQTPEQRVDALISLLITPDAGQMARYRRLVWT